MQDAYGLVCSKKIISYIIFHVSVKLCARQTLLAFFQLWNDALQLKLLILSFNPRETKLKLEGHIFLYGFLYWEFNHMQYYCDAISSSKKT